MVGGPGAHGTCTERRHRVRGESGSPVNFRNIFFNPHGHGTHTESVGHIAPEVHPVGEQLKRYFFTAQLISLRPEERRAPDAKTDLGDEDGNRAAQRRE